MSALEAREYTLRLRCAGRRRCKTLPPTLDIRGGFAIKYEIILSKLAPRGVKGERGFLRRVEPLSQHGDLLPKLRATPWWRHL